MDAVEEGASWVGRRAPELVCSGKWLNSEPLSLEGLAKARKIVLLEFLSYSCVNCIRTFPALNWWQERYKDEGLVIIGIHTPEFEFEKDAENLRQALEKYGLQVPVMQDNDYLTWKAFANRYWPRKFLLDQEGNVAYDQVGEGHHEETERKIRETLGLRRKPAKETEKGGPSVATAGNEGRPLTEELYIGYARGLIGNIEGFEPDEEIEYATPEYREDEIVYVKGRWMSRAQYMHHSRDTPGKEDYACVRFYGRSVNGVLAPAHGQAFTLQVEIGGKPLERKQAGKDVKYDACGRSFVEVREARMYELVSGNNPLGWHDLKLISDSREYCLYSLTFGL